MLLFFFPQYVHGYDLNPSMPGGNSQNEKVPVPTKEIPFIFTRNIAVSIYVLLLCSRMNFLATKTLALVITFEPAVTEELTLEVILWTAGDTVDISYLTCIIILSKPFKDS